MSDILNEYVSTQYPEQTILERIETKRRLIDFYQTMLQILLESPEKIPGNDK